MTSYFIRRISEDTLSNLVKSKSLPSLLELYNNRTNILYNKNQKLLLFSKTNINNNVSVCMYVEHFGFIDFNEWDCSSTYFVRGI